MANLSVTIDGLALFRMVDEQWKIYFPQADDHPFKLIIERVSSTINNKTIYELPASTLISFFPDSNNRNETGSKGVALEDLESKGLAQFHKAYWGETDIQISSDLEFFASILTLNGTSLQNKEKDEQDDVIVWTVKEEKDVNNIVTKSTRTRKNDIKLGNQLYSEYTITDGITKIEIRNDSVNFDLDLDFSSGDKYILSFIHDCEVLKIEGTEKQIIEKGCMETSDFKHYYKILDTKNRVELSVEPKTPQRPNVVCSPTGG